MYHVSLMVIAFISNVVDKVSSLSVDGVAGFWSSSNAMMLFSHQRNDEKTSRNAHTLYMLDIHSLHVVSGPSIGLGELMSAYPVTHALDSSL